MSYTVPYSFVPGTKARAQEVNANFSSILESMEVIDDNKVNIDLSNISATGLDVIKNNSSLRNIGELVFSPIPINDYGLHLLDGSLLQGNGIYKSFYDYMGSKYHSTITYNPQAFTIVGSPTITNDGISSGFTNNPVSNIKVTLVPTSNNYTVTGEFTTPASLDGTIPFSAGANVDSVIQVLFSLRIDTTNSNKIILLARNSGDTNSTISDSNVLASPSTSYKYKIVVNGANCSFYIDNTLVGSINNFCQSLPAYFIIGADITNTSPFTGTSDLKSFTITESGAEIVNGGKVCNYFTDEQTWQDTVETYGECGKFVYNENEGTIRLPRINGLLEFSPNTAESGNIVEAGLPNIIGKQTAIRRDGSVNNYGALHSTLTREGVSSGTGGGKSADINFNASWSNPIYGKSSTVQPQTIKYLVYIVVASTPKTNLQVDIDNIVTDLNGKLDVDLSNLASSNLNNFDGQWVYKHSALNNNATLNIGKYDVDLSSYLPNGQNKYEVIVNIYATQTTSTSIAYLILSSGIIPEPGTTLQFACLGANSNSRIQGLQTTFPVGTNKILSYRIGGQSFDNLYIRLCGYRRIGTNG